ncbi:Cell division septal protein FtsQ [Fodinibius salinus]|uniref:Cell division septal protein FtsQ n=1 Tax=Fodinibius salinus TaxID=860790 RepID=A0A5D3YFL7_9BACT|nr:cell division protein FtsQ/DivIB [Fodinibius salinus]TYP92216.1 Cell division septal protein FtsQ [Fodinibius salinus]
MVKNKSHNKTESTKKPLAWVAGAIFVLGLAIIGGLSWSSTVTVQEIQYRGNHFVSTERLKQVEVPTGISPDSMNFVDIIRRFKKLAYVKNAAANVEPNGNLSIDINERQPIAMLTDGSTKVYVDKHGIRLPKVLGKTIDVPILYGFSATPMSDTLHSESFKRVSDFLTNVHDKPVSNATISEVAWTEKEGVVALTNQNGVKLIFGKGNYETRLRNWEAFYGEVVKQKGIKKMRSVDLRFEGQIVTREKEI